MKQKKDSKTRRYVFKKEIIRSWWVLACILFGYVIFIQATEPLQKTLKELNHSLESLSTKKLELEQSVEVLSKIVKSQEEEQWTALILKEKLNRVPSGEIKVIFPQPMEEQ